MASVSMLLALALLVGTMPPRGGTSPVNPQDIPRTPGIAVQPAKLPESSPAGIGQQVPDSDRNRRETADAKPTVPPANIPVIRPAGQPGTRPSTQPVLTKPHPSQARPTRDSVPSTLTGQQKPQTLPAHVNQQRPQTHPTTNTRPGLNGNREGLTKPSPLPSQARPARDTVPSTLTGQQKPQTLPALVNPQKPQTLPALVNPQKPQTLPAVNPGGLARPLPGQIRPTRDTVPSTLTGQQKPQTLPATNTQPGLNGNREGLTRPLPTPARLARDTVPSTLNGQQKPQTLPALVSPQTLPGINQEEVFKPAPLPSLLRPARDTEQQKPQTLPALVSPQKPQTLPATNTQPGLNGNNEGLTKPSPIPSQARPTRDTVPSATTGQQKPQTLPAVGRPQKPQTQPATGARPGSNGKPNGQAKPATLPSKPRPVRDTDQEFPQEFSPLNEEALPSFNIPQIEEGPSAYFPDSEFASQDQ